MSTALYRRLFRNCWRKDRHHFLYQAAAAARRLADQSGMKLYGYTCQYCGKWHLTKQPTFDGEPLRLLAVPDGRRRR